jgi:hypothetical protein
MEKLSRENLLSLEQYAESRPEFRDRIMAHKINRRQPIGPNASLYFEDYMTMQYQVQEMLRAERIFEAREIEEEINAYNPLIPDGRNWKATFMLEYPDENERRIALAQLRGIEDRIWIQVQGYDKVWGIADEDLQRENEEKTSAVHFMRFELSDEMAEAVKSGAAISLGIEHAKYCHQVEPIADDVRASLAEDLA